MKASLDRIEHEKCIALQHFPQNIFKSTLWWYIYIFTSDATENITASSRISINKNERNSKHSAEICKKKIEKKILDFFPRLSKWTSLCSFSLSNNISICLYFIVFSTIFAHFNVNTKKNKHAIFDLLSTSY